MTITLQTVNELIASLESAGELSIREQKFLKLAKAFKQLAAENVALKESRNNLAEFIHEELDADYPLNMNLETHATDRIVAGIKADGVEEFAAYQRAITEEWACKEGHSSLLKVAESAELFAQQLRDGADK
ncbi:hypothetical protein I4171_05135 [Klebsiella pneumoniae]|uniref:hypothetical protein n=1 Tax=Klebsiella pneumoniae TaxID=573 RepID=UPI000F61C907|nr:hypothetical protein [Klebsiella pneumoniae]MBG2717170.1 hypothetical protein [Klebsiella michiganensis]HDT0759639.1 hypothetical protein [Klebsiella pneumoniae subsp. pneumoniae]MBD7194369.1 hypothetical protein [Klebsiella pneumoniae]MBD7544147.1 hypothetical protein [Klebsiella pneumoniae]MBD7580085.1 hypothetical protein [Klebsiella pneumoniae]